jgi:hypothetical protein
MSSRRAVHAPARGGLQGAACFGAQVTEINTPQVRLIPPAELELRAAAGAAYLAAAAEAGDAQRRADIVARLKPEHAACLGGDGSSSEDTSDEAYAVRHLAGEEEERTRFLGAAGAHARTCTSLLWAAAALGPCVMRSSSACARLCWRCQC